MDPQFGPLPPDEGMAGQAIQAAIAMIPSPATFPMLLSKVSQQSGAIFQVAWDLTARGGGWGGEQLCIIFGNTRYHRMWNFMLKKPKKNTNTLVKL